MRIGLVSAEYPPAIGGVGDHTACLARELVSLGHTVEVLTSAAARPDSSLQRGEVGRGETTAEPQRTEGAPTVLPAISRWDWRILRDVPRVARQRHWDILHIQYQPAAYRLHGAINVLPAWTRLGRRLGALPGRPAVVTTFHDLRVPYLFPKAGALREQAVRLLARASDAAIAVDEGDLPTLRRWLPDPTCSVHVPLGNQLDAPPPPEWSHDACRERLGVAPGAALIGYLGLINRSKGVDTLVDAVAALHRQGRDVHLVMVGEQLGASDATNAAYLREVRTRVAQAGLEARVHWTGYQMPEQITGWLRTVDVVALPFTDGASLRRTSLIAAWAQGAPVVTTPPSGGSAWQQVSREPVARLVQSGDAGALAGAIAELLDQPQRREALARAGRDFAGRFSWPDVARQTLTVYVVALGQAPSAPPPPPR